MRFHESGRATTKRLSYSQRMESRLLNERKKKKWNKSNKQLRYGVKKGPSGNITNQNKTKRKRCKTKQKQRKSNGNSNKTCIKL